MISIISEKVNKIDYFNLLKKGKLTMAGYLDLCDCITQLLNKNPAYTIMQDVAKVFKKHKFAVVEHGIGWVIEPNISRKGII